MTSDDNGDTAPPRLKEFPSISVAIQAKIKYYRNKAKELKKGDKDG